MPSKSKAQQRFMGADLARAKKGEQTKTGMKKTQLEEYARTPTVGLPYHVKKSKGR